LVEPWGYAFHGEGTVFGLELDSDEAAVVFGGYKACGAGAGEGV
jgi:hypothetical protein